MDITKHIKERKMWKWLLAIGFFVAPYGFIAAIPTEWLGRLIGLGVLYAWLAPLIFWWGLNPKTQFIKKGAKLLDPEFNKVRSKIVFVIRASVVCFGLVFLIAMVIPFVLDVGNLILTRNPQPITGKVESVSKFFLARFVFPTIKVEGRKDKCHFPYPMGLYLKSGRTYQMIVLPHSKVILRAEELKGPVTSPG